MNVEECRAEWSRVRGLLVLKSTGSWFIRATYTPANGKPVKRICQYGYSTEARARDDLLRFGHYVDSLPRGRSPPLFMTNEMLEETEGHGDSDTPTSYTRKRPHVARKMNSVEKAVSKSIAFITCVEVWT